MIVKLLMLLALLYPSILSAQTVWTYCARENETCSFLGSRKNVRYGANGIYYQGVFDNSVECNNSTFGDPIIGVVKACDMSDIVTPPPVGNVVKASKGQNVWTNGVSAWAGPKECSEAGVVLSPISPAIDMGVWESWLHCPVAGFSTTPDCMEWFGKAPDAGACEYVPIELVGGGDGGLPLIGTLTMEVIP
jgi:hypothetical protein